MKYHIRYDNHSPIYFVGNTHYNGILFEYFKRQRECYHVTVEDIKDRDTDFFKTVQLFSGCSNVSFKKLVADTLDSKNPNWVSVLGDDNLQYYDVDIGRNTFVNYYNFLQTGARVGDHCTITTHSIIGHDSVVKDFCHVSAYTLINHATLGTGTCVGLRTTIVGKPDSPVNIADYTNLTMNSSVNKTIDTAGTYNGNRQLSAETSLTYKFF